MTAALDVNGQARVLGLLPYLQALARCFPDTEDAESVAYEVACETIARNPTCHDWQVRCDVVQRYTLMWRRSRIRATMPLNDPAACGHGPSVYRAIEELEEPHRQIAQKLWIDGAELTVSERRLIPVTRRKLIRLLEDQA